MNLDIYIYIYIYILYYKMLVCLHLVKFHAPFGSHNFSGKISQLQRSRVQIAMTSQTSTGSMEIYPAKVMPEKRFMVDENDGTCRFLG